MEKQGALNLLRNPSYFPQIPLDLPREHYPIIPSRVFLILDADYMLDNVRRAIIGKTSVGFWFFWQFVRARDAIEKELFRRVAVERERIFVYRVATGILSESHEIVDRTPNVDQSVVWQKSLEHGIILVGPSSRFDGKRDLRAVFETKSENEMREEIAFSERNRIDQTAFQDAHVVRPIKVRQARWRTSFRIPKIPYVPYRYGVTVNGGYRKKILTVFPFCNVVRVGEKHSMV